MNIRNSLSILAIIIVAGASWMVITPASTSSNHQATLPQTRLPALDGTSYSLASWQGKQIVLNFWATWCGPCREEMPEFVRLQQELGSQGVQFVGIAIDEEEPVRAFTERLGINYPILLAEHEGSELSRQLGNDLGVLPYSIVLDEKGNIIHREHGLFERGEILTALGI